jgi:hypothetical protein
MLRKVLEREHASERKHYSAPQTTQRKTNHEQHLAHSAAQK